MTKGLAAFDFKQHEQQAVSEYQRVHSHFVSLADCVRRILAEAVRKNSIKVHSIEGRAKDPLSFGRKAAKPSEFDPLLPKYPNPLKEITDLAGIRVITFFRATLQQVDKLIEDEFLILERSDKGATLLEEDKFGYQSIHYLVKIATKRSMLPEYSEFADSIIEIQVRTILQHSWAEIEHDIQYKSASTIPQEIHRRFMAVAGMLEIADREFQAIHDADQALTQEATKKVSEGVLAAVEITPSSLKQYLDLRLGADGRLSEFAYEWTTRTLKSLGFKTLDQVDTCIHGIDHSKVNKVAKATRQGPTSRFENMVFVGMGSNFITRHPFSKYPETVKHMQGLLDQFIKAGIKINTFDPLETDVSFPRPVSREEPAS